MCFEWHSLELQPSSVAPERPASRSKGLNWIIIKTVRITVTFSSAVLQGLLACVRCKSESAQFLFTWLSHVAWLQVWHSKSAVMVVTVIINSLSLPFSSWIQIKWKFIGFTLRTMSLLQLCSLWLPTVSMHWHSPKYSTTEIRHRMAKIQPDPFDIILHQGTEALPRSRGGGRQPPRCRQPRALRRKLAVRSPVPEAPALRADQGALPGAAAAGCLAPPCARCT